MEGQRCICSLKSYAMCENVLQAERLFLKKNWRNLRVSVSFDLDLCHGFVIYSFEWECGGGLGKVTLLSRMLFCVSVDIFFQFSKIWLTKKLTGTQKPQKHSCLLFSEFTDEIKQSLVLTPILQSASYPGCTSRRTFKATYAGIQTTVPQDHGALQRIPTYVIKTATFPSVQRVRNSPAFNVTGTEIKQTLCIVLIFKT